MRKLTLATALVLTANQVDAHHQECVWADDKGAGLRLVGTFTDTHARFTLHNDGPSAKRVTEHEFRRIHDCPSERYPDAKCTIEGDNGMGFNFLTVWPGDHIRSAVALPRRNDPRGNPAAYYAVRVRVRDVGSIGTPDPGFTSIPWGRCSVDQVPVPALPWPFMLLGAGILWRRGRAVKPGQFGDPEDSSLNQESSS